MTDNDIIAGFRKDEDKRWVGMLYERYAHLVLGLCFKYLKEKNAAEDATCDIFMSLFDKLNKHEVSNFRSWLYSTSRNHCLMILRSKKNGHTVPINGQEPIVDEQALSIAKLKDGQLDLLESKLEKLRPEQRDCLRFFYLDENSYVQVSERTSMDLKAVKSHIQNGKRNLRILLEQHREFNGS